MMWVIIILTMGSLIAACESLDPLWTALSKQTRGILFYSVPHRGSPLANLNLPLLRQSIELTEVQKSKYLINFTGGIVGKIHVNKGHNTTCYKILDKKILFAVNCS